jgi:phosphate transport system protein
VTTRPIFDRELQRIQDDVLELGSMVETALVEAVEILRRRDMDAARRLIAQDQTINEKRFAIEANALTLIATQQPVARDIRTLAAVLEITTELERIGDYVKGIAKINLLLGEGPLLEPVVYLPRMAEKARQMLFRALGAFVQGDVGLARVISDQDSEVDELYNRVYRGLLDCIMQDTSAIDQSNYLLWAAHNLERAADRVVNICERVVFTVTGEMVEMDTEDDAAPPVGQRQAEHSVAGSG